MNKIYANGNYFFVQLGTDITPSSDAKGNVIVNINHDLNELLLSSALTVNTTAGNFGLFTINTISLDGDFTSLISANVTTFKFTYLDAGLIPQEWTGKASVVTYIPIDDKTYITPIFSGFIPVSTDGSNMIGNQKFYSIEPSYQIASPKIGLLNLPLSTLADVNGNAYTQATWEAFYLANSGFNPASGGSGAGVMTKSVYDTNDDGIVDTADKEMIQVINKTGSTITKGSIVYLKSTSSSGTHPEILLASASTEATSSKTIGAVYEDILNDGLGYVVTSGEVRNAVTNAYAIGTKLWLSNTPGLVQTTPPTQPLHSVFIGTVTRSQANNGRILYAIQNGYELDELHDVDSSNKGNNTVLGVVTSSGLNVYKTIAEWLGFTPQNTISLTTIGTSGAATFNGTTLNIPQYSGGSSPLIPFMQGDEVFRGVVFGNNSTTIVTSGGITNNLSGSQFANSVATTNYRTRQHTMRFEPSVVSTGNYCCMRSSAALWSISGGFYFVGHFGISDAAYAVGSHNFWGLTDSTSNLAIGGMGNSQPSALLNIIALANDSGDANLQIMHNDGVGVATKIDLGVNFPSNRTSGAILTNMYLVEFYNASNTNDVIYRVTNKENGSIAQGTISTNLPSNATLLAYQAGRSMGTGGGGVSSSGRFDVARLGVYTI